MALISGGGYAMLVPTIQRRRCLNYLRHIKQERILSVLSKKLSHAAGTFVRSKNHLRLTLAVVGFALLADLTRAESVVPGSDRHSITPGQATKMEWREQGLKTRPLKIIGLIVHRATNYQV